ncbi:MAG: DUF2294 family protein [Thermoleophilaceae bacterium]|nr:DUF2294 family protein [Thermoleophilaceae bacterium]
MGQLDGGRMLVALSREIVGIFRDSVGKGPDQCRTYWAGKDMVVVLLSGGYTAAEQTLFEAGRGSTVQESRHAIQQALGARMRSAVESVAGRQVIAFMSASHQAPDLSAELFVFAPQSGDRNIT